MDGSFFECVDAGSENCPCYLALTNDCMTCTRLKGLDYCDCRWAGVCIYNEFIWNGKQVKNLREDINARIVNRKSYHEVEVLVLKTDKYLVQRFKYPGTYIFVRNPEDRSIYDVPISIMDTDPGKGEIHIAVKTISAKTKKIIKAEESLIIRGPYRNGLLGLKNIKDALGGKMLVLAKSMGMAPAVKLVKYFDGHCEIDLMADMNRLRNDFAEEYLSGCHVNVQDMNFKDRKDLDIIKDLIKKKDYEKIVIFTSDKYISIFDALLKSIGYYKDYAVVNNFNMCCGEGVCGACSVKTEDGKVIKMCKCQMKGEEVAKRGQKNV